MVTLSQSYTSPSSWFLLIELAAQLHVERALTGDRRRLGPVGRLPLAHRRVPSRSRRLVRGGRSPRFRHRRSRIAVVVRHQVSFDGPVWARRSVDIEEWHAVDVSHRQVGLPDLPIHRHRLASLVWRMFSVVNRARQRAVVYFQCHIHLAASVTPPGLFLGKQSIQEVDEFDTAAIAVTATATARLSASDRPQQHPGETTRGGDTGLAGEEARPSCPPSVAALHNSASQATEVRLRPNKNMFHLACV